MKNRTRWVVLVTALCLVPCSAVETADRNDTWDFFPDFEGWTKEAAPEYYSPENLFEYIDGAADLYLSYGFEGLATLTYRGDGERSLSVEVYRHADLRNAFGIYSQERPTAGRFLDVGTEGHYETGFLAFFHGRHYVKLIGFGLGGEDEKVLTELATAIARRLGGEPVFPPALDVFPAEGKVAHSERFVPEGVLGHAFLHAAYTADYEIAGSTVTLFLIEGENEADASGMLEKYLGLARTAGPVASEGKTWRFRDPRRSAAGRMNLRHAGRYVWGLASDDTGAADRLLDAIGANLESRGLFE